MPQLATGLTHLCAPVRRGAWGPVYLCVVVAMVWRENIAFLGFNLRPPELFFNSFPSPTDYSSPQTE